jgi:hypothetical protein
VAKYYSPSGKAIQDTMVTPSTAVQETEPAADPNDDVEPVEPVPGVVTPAKEGDAILLKGTEIVRKIS